MKRVVYLTVLAILQVSIGLGVAAYAMDVSIRFVPEVMMPLDDSGNYSVGGGGTLFADVEALRGLSPFAEAAVRLVPLKGTGSLLTMASGGIGTGYSFYPVPRLKLRAAGGGGFFNASALGSSRYGLFWEARAEAGYRFSPTMSLLAGAGYSSFLRGPSPSDTFLNGLTFGLTFDIALGSPAARSSGVILVANQREIVFPIQYYAYAKTPIGAVTVTNNESAEISDVEVRFKSDGLTSAPILCGKIPLLRQGGSAEVPFLAAFGERVLEFTEKSKAQGEFTISYRLLDTKIERTFSTAVSFNHRNAVTWKNTRAVAAFVSPNDSAVLDISKFAAGLVRDHLRPDIDHSLQYGMGVFEALRLTGLSYAADPSAPYRECRNDPTRTDYVQYPYQTFAYKGGDSDDLAILFIAALESVGLDTALVPLQDKAYAAFALASSEEDARRFFADASLFAWREGKAWVVVDASRLREGFLASWRAGADAWNAAVASRADTAFFELDQAWKDFRPVGVNSADTKVVKPREDRLELAFENAVGRFVSAEVGPRVERIKAEMDSSGGTARQLNSLGILYARYGLYKEARLTFTDAVAKGSRTAIINLANTVFLLKDYAEAARLYEETLKLDPMNKSALLGLARARYELDAYADADDLYARVNQIDPAFASKYAYLSSRIGTGTGASRAASADREGSVPWQDAE